MYKIRLCLKAKCTRNRRKYTRNRRKYARNRRKHGKQPCGRATIYSSIDNKLEKK